MPSTDPLPRSEPRFAFPAQLVAYSAALFAVAAVEIPRWFSPDVKQAGLISWLFDGKIDNTTLYLILLDSLISWPLLLLAPLFWWAPRPRFSSLKTWSDCLGDWFGTSTKPIAGQPLHGQGLDEATANRPPAEESAECPVVRTSVATGALWRAWCLALVVAATSFVVSTSIAAKRIDGPLSPRFGDLPPAYHDEFSYLFQAKTFLAGRLKFPSHPEAAHLFDQMHVLNDGSFASRYFPGTGAWIAPFLKLDHPYWGHWLAGALTAFFFFWAGRELAGNGVGFLAGLLTAVSPGMGLFSNLLLSHHPTLVGLSLFTFTFLRMLRTGCLFDALLAGTGLCLAMLSRPLTAAAVALPFGISFFWSLARGTFITSGNRTSRKYLCAAALGMPLLFGMIALVAFNKPITGNPWRTPYQVYTDTYTPRHVYGFNNRVRGEEQLGPKVLDHYDRWAENLTPSLAIRNVRNRILASWQWSLSSIPLLIAVIIFVAMVPASDPRCWLVPAAIVSLHLAHVPYWFDGTMHWHYVFESGPYLLLLLALATQALFTNWKSRRRLWMPLWWSTLLGMSLFSAYASWETYWPTSRVDVGLEQIAFSRLRYAAFYRLVNQQVTERPALVLVEPDPNDRHIDYVVNDPALAAGVLYARYLPERTQIADVLRLFPQRTCYHYLAKEEQLQRLTREP
jgi:hypothetical protein